MFLMLFFFHFLMFLMHFVKHFELPLKETPTIVNIMLHTTAMFINNNVVIGSKALNAAKWTF